MGMAGGRVDAAAEDGHHTLEAKAEDHRPTRRRVCNNDDLQSPLRYPGGKRQLVPFFVDLLKINGLTPLELFIEPFSGGAAVSLHLLAAGAVEHVVLAERDPQVYAFWREACYNTETLIGDILNADVTLEEWHRLREYPGRSLRELAYACLFLNRTSYSGILHGRAGPIGGQRQTSKYKVDCRFPKEEIAARIRRIGKLAADGRILSVLPHDFETTVWDVEERFKSFERLYYFDPPFYDKGSRLYRHAFEQSDHVRLATLLKSLARRWVLSYDYHEEILDLYKRSTASDDQSGGVAVLDAAHELHTAELQYGNRHADKAATELVITNLAQVPEGHVRRAAK
jgi:DNA adenine methylase